MNRFYVETKNGKISYLKRDGNPLIIMLHGLGGMGNNFMKIASCINPDYGLIFPDLLGHGNSERPSDITVKLQAESIHELIENLDIKKYYIGGNSYGGWVSLYHEYMHNGAEGIILISSAGTNPTVSEYGGENEKSFIERVMRMNPSNNPQTLENILHNNGSGEYKITEEMLSKIDCKALIIWGENDPIIPIEYGRFINKGLKNSEFHIIKGGGHITQVTHPERVCSLVNNFL